MIVRDSLTLDASGLSVTRDGYLSGLAKVSRAGNVQKYRGSELGLTGDEAGRIFGVYRDPEVVFDEASMMSLAGRPVTRGHPPTGVDASNWKDLVVGNMGGKVVRDGEHVVAPMAIMDAAAAQEVLGGARSLSAGYTVGITRDSGIASDGTPYEFRQSGELRFNHVAYLPDNNPRAGNTRIGDSAFSWGIQPLTVSDEKGGQMADLRKMTWDGMPFAADEAGAAVFDKLTKAIADMKAEMSEAEKKAADEKAAMEAEMAAKDAALAASEAAKLDDAAIDARVAARADLITRARSVVADLDVAGLSDADIRKAAVVAKLGDAAIEGKSAAYIDARFDILTETKADPLKETKLAQKPVTDLDAIYADRNKALNDAWKKGAN